jgi:hypothetical protein
MCVNSRGTFTADSTGTQPTVTASTAPRAVCGGGMCGGAEPMRGAENDEGAEDEGSRDSDYVTVTEEVCPHSVPVVTSVALVEATGGNRSCHRPRLRHCSPRLAADYGGPLRRPQYRVRRCDCGGRCLLIADHRAEHGVGGTALQLSPSPPAQEA